MTRRKPTGSAIPDAAFLEAIAESERLHHEAWLNRGPGDGMALEGIGWIGYHLDPEGVRRVKPTMWHGPGDRPR